MRGRAWFALDPNTVANATIADIKLAPRDARGLVRFSAEFQVLRPTISSRGNGTMLYEVNNRGNIAILSQINEAPPNNNPTSGSRRWKRVSISARFHAGVVGLGLRCRAG